MSSDVLTPLNPSYVEEEEESYDVLPLNSPDEERSQGIDIISLGPSEGDAPTQDATTDTTVASRRSLFAFMMEAVWFAIVNIALLIALIIDWNNQCEGAFDLKKWAQIQMVIQTLMLFSGWAMHTRTSRGQTRRTPAMAALYIVHRLLNMFWIIWSITGIVWTFDSKGCSSSIPVLYTMCLIFSIINIVIMGLPIVVCCCSIPVTILTYCCCPSLFGIKPPKKASPRLIKSVTTKKSYKEDMMSKDDANCAICLSEYEPKDDLRFLRCGHHFHDDCIMQWLVKNKTCPFCKQEIDQIDEAKPKEEPSQPSSDHVAIEMSQIQQNAVASGSIIPELEESDDEIPLTNPHLELPQV